MKRARTHRTLMVPVAIAAMSLGVVACSSPPKQSDPQPPAQSTRAEPQRYDLKGTVVSVDKSGKKLTVDHEAIPGFMGAMTMPYPVKDEHLLDNLAPGDDVTAKVVSGNGEFWLENIVVATAGPPAK
jgi:protein SCO1/2